MGFEMVWTAAWIAAGMAQAPSTAPEPRFPVTAWGLGESTVASEFEVVDLDRDGALDVLAVFGFGGGLVWLRGDGHGAEVSRVRLTSPFSGYFFVDSGDFNGDGWPDLVTAGEFVHSGLAVHMGDGLGGVSPEQIVGPLNGFAHRPRVADLNHDGFDDVVCFDSGTSSIATLLGGPNGLKRHLAAPALEFEWVDELLLADFDGDGELDCAMNGKVLPTHQRFTMLALGDGRGGFRQRFLLPDQRLVLGADLDGDGASELLTRGALSYSITRLVGGQFQSQPISFAVGFRPMGAADLDHDGSSELLCGGFDVVRVIPYSNGGNAGAFKELHMPGLHAGLLAADLDGDGFEALIARLEDGPMLTASSAGGGGFLAHRICEGIRGAEALAAGDVDGDGRADVVASGNGIMEVFLGGGAGDFGLHWRRSVSHPIGELQLVDLDSDGDLDVLGRLFPSYPASPRAFSALNDGAGRFASVNEDAQPQIDPLRPGDFDGDGAIDLLLRTPSSLEVRRGDGSGAFGPAVVTNTNPLPSFAYVVADFDEDGRSDFVQAGVNVLRCFRGMPDASMTETLAPAISFAPWRLASGDFNGDGHADLACLRWTSVLKIVCWLGDGSFGFGSPVETVLPDGDDVIELVARRFDGDALDDLGVVQLSPWSFNIDRMGMQLAVSDGAGAFRVGQRPVAEFPVFADIDGDGRSDFFGAFETSPPTLGAYLGR